MDREDVIDLLSVIAANDHRTVGQMDIGVWYSMLSGRFSKEDCLTAIMDHFRDSPSVWLTPGHIVTRVRAIMRDRTDRMDPDERPGMVHSDPPASAQSRAAALAACIAAMTSGETDSPDDVPYVNVLLVPCDYCRAPSGERCTIAGMPGKPAEQLTGIPGHPSRIVKAAVTAGYSEDSALEISAVWEQRQARRAKARR